MRLKNKGFYLTMDKTQQDLKFALITPSYGPDFDRCKLLVESTKHCITDGTQHYIVVDRRDVELFRLLSSQRTHILVVEDLLPSWIFRAPGFKNWWISLRTLPIRNWILQQLIKMSICDVIAEDVLVFCDSDNTFIRPFDMKSCLMKDNKLALLRVGFQNKDIQHWINSSKRILAIENKSIQPVTYVSNMIAWHKINVLKMRNHIEKVHGKHWIRVACKPSSISEYMIYGIFVDYVLGLEAANHFHFNTELMKPSWSVSLDTESQVQEFFDEISDDHIGVMIHSKDDVLVNAYADKIKSFWK